MPTSRDQLQISIVTPSFNQRRTIGATIDSVLSQSVPAEYVVVDGGSTDGTLDVLKSYQALRWVSEPDRGQTHAINKGLAMTSGKIIAYLNSDDVYKPGAFESALEAFERRPDCVAVAGDCEVIDDDGRICGMLHAQFAQPSDLLRFWMWDSGVCLPQPAVFIRRSAIDQVGPFDETFDMAMDLEMFQRLAAAGPIVTLGKTLAAYRDSQTNKTNTRRADMLWDTYRAGLKHLDLAPSEERKPLANELRRKTAGHLLTIIEQDHPANSRGLALRALRCWPLIASSPRLWRALA